jgi:hypothetical protein
MAKPQKAAPCDRSEITIQTLFRSRVRIQCPAVRVVAIPNGAKRGQRAMNQALREGLQPGFPDVLCLAPGRVAFIEFKDAKGKLSPGQEVWLEKLSDMGFPATVCRDPDDGLAFLRANGFPFIMGEATA